MKFKVIDWYSWFIIVLVLGSAFVLLLYNGSDSSLVLSLLCCFSMSSSYFVFDMVGFYLSLLSVLLLFVLAFLFSEISGRSMCYIVISVVSSLLCYCSNNVFLFWWFYEVSILSLLFLLVTESPYSERYLAGWYLGGYVVLTSLPLLLCLFYFSSLVGSFNMSDWVVFLNSSGGNISFWMLILLGVLFITKIPIFPFHSWLPIVHAEATSIVSVCLSGYVMKLGLLGVCRFCWFVISNDLFCLLYVSLSFFFSIMFFLVASWELDGKRWLAFLSLSHIVICVVCFNSSLYDSCGLVFLYSLGHGLSAGLVFVFLWLGYILSGSRNWMILKFVFGGSFLFRFLLACSLCTLASLPPVVQFFVEISVLSTISGFSLILFIIFCVYLFFSSLIPLFVLGILISRQFCVCYSSNSSFMSFFSVLLFSLLWSFFVFLVI